MMHVGRSGDAPSRSQQPSDIADNVNHNNNNNDDNNNDDDDNNNNINNNNINIANDQQNNNNDLINALENKFDDKDKTHEGIYNDLFDNFKSDNSTTIPDNDSKGIANHKRPNSFNTHTVNSIEPLCTTNELATNFTTGDVLDSNTEKSHTNVDQTKRENLKKNDFYHFKTATELFQSNFLSESSCCLTKTTSSLRPSHSVDFLSFVCRQHLLLQQQKYKILFPDNQQTIKKLTGKKISSSLQNKVERTANSNTPISKEIPKTKKTRSDSLLLCNKKNSLDTESFIFKSDKDFKILQTPAGICEKDSIEKDISKQSNQDTESITSAVDMPVSYCYIRPSGSYVSVRNSKRSSSRRRKSSAVLSPSSSFTSFDESLASILDPLYRRSRHSSQKRSSSGGNKRMEFAVKSAFAMTMFSLMAGVVLTVCGFVKLEGWTDEQQLPMKILGPTCLTSTFVVWGVGGLFLYLWRSEWKREKQAMDLKTRVQFHAIAVDLLKKSTSNIGSPSNASILQSERKRRRKLITKLKQQEVLEISYFLAVSD
ncbi:hypothetical protein HELRODRAFT_188335 [Helobdella robusta]|uniref:Uncharacterized protein n=1 Tax=Helobdella robusta TaxID=6412 RepID=T1FPW5_HELRO|nr:hypothetical protein HELRODRAFT_188335 [Helobdella robusta]ESO06349.1 hypothetical protein HELRODRAFT_188335 [Helobdella robusta]